MKHKIQFTILLKSGLFTPMLLWFYVLFVTTLLTVYSELKDIVDNGVYIYILFIFSIVFISYFFTLLASQFLQKELTRNIKQESLYIKGYLKIIQESIIHTMRLEAEIIKLRNKLNSKESKRND